MFKILNPRDRPYRLKRASLALPADKLREKARGLSWEAFTKGARDYSIDVNPHSTILDRVAHWVYLTQGPQTVQTAFI